MTQLEDSARPYLEILTGNTQVERRQAMRHCAMAGVDLAEVKDFLDALGLQTSAGEVVSLRSVDADRQSHQHGVVDTATPALTCEYGHADRRPWCAPCRSNWPRLS